MTRGARAPGELRVELRADPDRGPVPARFGRRGARPEDVEAVLDGWPGEDHRYFRVRVSGGTEYILRQDLTTGRWRVHFFRRDR